MTNRKFSYITYTLPNGTRLVLTSRPDYYSDKQVNTFIDKFKPIVRLQMTDDLLKKERAKGIPFHWLSWFAGRLLPIEIAYFNISLINYYARKPNVTIWLHCDSSSMRAPTFTGLYLLCYYKGEMDKIIADSKYNCSYKRKSCPRDYAESSMGLDPGIKELVENWQEGGEEQAHNYLNNLRN